ncbi:MAG TPA: DUF3488 and transglutaminase-like domain-containing protein [Longimicrobiales bacterium]
MTPTPHRRLAALLALIALLAFASGAGFDAPAVLPAGIVLLIAIFVQPSERMARVLEPVWRVLALLLALRAGFVVFLGGGDAVLPMVDLLLLLLCAESLRPRDRAGDARHFALTFALLIASAAYRPGPAFALLFVLYVACATVMLVVGHLRRQAERRQLHVPQPTPRFMMRIALSSTVVLVVSALVFLFFPRVSRGWAARGAPTVSRTVVGFSDRVSLGDHGARIESNPEVVLRIEFPDGAPADIGSLHWRGRSYNRFDGVAWSRVERVSTPPLELRWSEGSIEQVIYGRRLAEANVLFGLHPVAAITPLSRIRPLRLPSGDHVYAGEAEPVYRVRSGAALPDPPALRRAQIGNAPDVVAHLQLPPLSGRMLALADSFRASSVTAYDQAIAVERWLRTQFGYTLELPRTAREATLDHFMFERRAGHCEYFSTAMAVLLRAGGVPARNVNGFLGGEWNGFGRFLTVTQNQAHSWVEVYFPGFGWVPFDPTPAGGAAGAAAAQRLGFAGLRRLADGLSHRWGKWVLDYDIGTQAGLLRRLSEPFAAVPADRQQADRALARRWYVLGGIVLAIVLLGSLRRFRGRSSRSDGAASRAYLSLRHAYERAGYDVSPATPPLAFAALVQSAPGAEAARAAIALYVSSRFGGRALAAEEQSQLEQLVRTARQRLRQERSRSVGERVRG